MAFRKGYKFHGVHYNTPGVYSFVKSDMVDVKKDGAKNIAILGKAKGGIPKNIMVIDDPEIAKEVVKGGPLLTAMLKAYDPVIDTKQGVELGGADQIFVIRTNDATKAKTPVYQSREVEAKIGKVVSTLHPSTTGEVTTSGAFSGEENKTFKIVITSEGTKDIAEAKYKVYAAGEEVGAEYTLDSTENTTDKELGDGAKVSFKAGKYTNGDTFLIPCTKAVTVYEYVYTIESKDWGEECNFISHKLDDGEVLGTKTLTIYGAKSDTYEVFENVGGAFDIRYKGNQQYAAMSIVSDGKGNAIKLQTYIGADEENAIVDLDIDLDQEQFKSVKQLALYIASYENYEINTVATVNSDLNVNDLDVLEKVSIKEQCGITAVLRDLEKTTAYQSRFVEIKASNREVVNYENYDFVQLLGGSEGQEAQSYIPFLDEIAKYDIDYIVPLTDDMSIIAECREHVIEMSERKGKERRLVCGAGNGLSALQAIKNARTLAHGRVQYFGVGHYDFDKKLYPAYITAAMHAGRAAFLGVESATNDTYKMLKPERTFEGRDRREMIDNGVMFFDEEVSDHNHKLFYPKLVWDYTTYTDKNDTLQVERSTGAIADQLSKDTRKRLDKILTGKLTPTGVLETARNAVLSILKDYQRKGIIVAYRNLEAKKERDKVYFRCEIAPATPTNFTFVDFLFYDQAIELDTI